MTEKTEALRLADALSAAIKQVDADDDVIHVARWFVEDADAELRRLSAENERLAAEVANRNRRALAGDEAVAALANVHAHYECLEAQRDALLEALQALYDEQEGPPLIRRHRQWQAAMDKARAAIAKAEGESHAKNL